MIAVAPTTPVEDWPGRHLLDGAAARRAALAREAVQRLVWNPAVRGYCHPFTVEGATTLRPAVYVANHASHADTAAVRAAFSPHGRRRLAVAAAEDYFFSTARRAVLFTVAVGAFPFPRSGAEGLRRTADLLAGGWSVLLFPQGTRGGDGTYRPGALRLAAQGWPIIPVGIAGTDRLLPKGAHAPRRSPTAVVFGPPLPADVTERPDGVALFAAAIDSAALRAKHLVTP